MRRYISTFSLAFIVAGLLLLFFGLRVVRNFVQTSDLAGIQKQEELPLNVLYSLVEASSLGNLERVKRLISSEKVSPNIVDQLGRSPLRSAIESGHLEIAKYLLDNGANKDDIDLEGNSALLLSVRHQKLEPFLLLLEKGANVNYRSKIGRTALYEAALLGNYVMMEKLIKAGADVHAVDLYGNTIIHAAVMSEDIPVLRMAIATSVDIDSQNEAGITPLGLAVSHQLLPQVTVLLDNEAVISLKDDEGQNVLLLAVRGDEMRKQRQEQVAKEIETAGKNKTAEEIREMNLQDLRKTERIVGTILNYTIRTDSSLVNKADNIGRTPLMYAALNGNFLVVKTLLKAGADLNMQDQNGMSALHLAIQEGYSVIAEDLVAAGAAIDIQNKQGRTPVQLAQDLGNDKLERVLTRQAQEEPPVKRKKRL